MNFQRGKEKEPSRSTSIPLIDVLLVILIFLMITTTYSKYTELQINLPTADANKPLERSNEINVVVSAQGQYVDQQHRRSPSASMRPAGRRDAARRRRA